MILEVKENTAAKHRPNHLTQEELKIEDD